MKDIKSLVTATEAPIVVCVPLYTLTTEWSFSQDINTWGWNTHDEIRIIDMDKISTETLYGVLVARVYGSNGGSYGEVGIRLYDRDEGAVVTGSQKTWSGITTYTIVESDKFTMPTGIRRFSAQLGTKDHAGGGASAHCDSGPMLMITNY